MMMTSLHSRLTCLHRPVPAKPVSYPVFTTAARSHKAGRSLKQHIRMASAADVAQTTGPSSSSRDMNGVFKPSPSDDVSGPMLEPSAFNKPWVRLASITAAVVVAARSTEFLPAKAAAFIHVTAWSLWLGSNFWTTFVGGITMFKNMPRQTFGRVQAKLFPKYFALGVFAGILQMGTLAFGVPGGIAKAQLLTLGTAVAASVANWVYIEPKATDLMFERYALENAPGEKDAAQIKALYKSFGKFHGISSLLNLGALIALVAHGWWLASNLTFAI